MKRIEKTQTIEERISAPGAQPEDKLNKGSDFAKVLQKYPELGQLIESWPGLPDNIKAAIKTLIKTNRPEKHKTVKQLFDEAKTGKYADCILFLQLIEDFYECYFEDAEICSRVCGLPLEKRSRNDEAVSFVQIPCDISRIYFTKLRKAGCKLAVETDIRGVIKKDTLRLLKQGTSNEPSGQNET